LGKVSQRELALASVCLSFFAFFSTTFLGCDLLATSFLTGGSKTGDPSDRGDCFTATLLLFFAAAFTLGVSVLGAVSGLRGVLVFLPGDAPDLGVFSLVAEGLAGGRGESSLA